MSSSHAQPPLIEFPCDYQFKIFGPAAAEAGFVAAVQEAAGTVLPICLDAMRVRESGQGRYLCVTLVARLHNREQLDRLYAAFRALPQLLYLL